jgi:hypothetical protein
MNFQDPVRMASRRRFIHPHTQSVDRRFYDSKTQDLRRLSEELKLPEQRLFEKS